MVVVAVDAPEAPVVTAVVVVTVDDKAAPETDP